jgi:CRISPR-associated protein Cpf1
LYKTDYIDSWTIYSYGDGRIVHTKKDGYDTTVRINVTDELIALMKEYNVDFTNGNIIENICNIDKDKNEKEFFKKFLWLFRSIVQLRYEDKNNDFIMSPVMYENRFFDSRKALDNEPVDGDANGAYHIALQGLRMMSRIENGKINSDEKNKQAYNWFKFVQSKAYQK